MKGSSVLKKIKDITVLNLSRKSDVKMDHGDPTFFFLVPKYLLKIFKSFKTVTKSKQTQ